MNGLTFDYRGAHVLVTGGTSGIGLGCARAYAAAGAQVMPPEARVAGLRAPAGKARRTASGSKIPMT